MPDILHFHNLSTIFISLIGAMLLLAIYFNIRKRFKKVLEEETPQKRVDKGLLNLGLAMLVWVAAGIWALAGTYFEFTNTFTDQFGIHLLSTINNMFLLFALSYFIHAPELIS
jgi:Na+/melibiose symporter-like transporter